MKIPILLYHNIKDDNFDLSLTKPELAPYILKKSQFCEQIKWLHENEYKTISLEDFVDGKEKNSSKFICIVFDDGWKSNYEIAYPALKKYGFKATFFVTIEYIEKKDMMTWSDLKEMQDNDMIIGSHSMTHRPCVELSDKELKNELIESKNVLEQKLGRKIDFYSSPTGFVDSRIEKFAKQSGYKVLCRTKAVVNNLKQSSSKFISLNKIGIKRNCQIEVFKGIVKGKKGVLMPLYFKQIVRDKAKSMLGPKKYNGLKCAIQRMASCK